MTAPMRVALPAHLPTVRVGGTLTEDARLAPSVGADPHAFLFLHLQPPPPSTGLPYHARVDLGTDTADHRAAEALLPQLRRGAFVSLAGTGIQPRTDHGHAVLTVLGASHVVLLQPDPSPIPSETSHAH